MNIYETRQDVIDELTQHLQVEYKPHGTWKIKSYLGGRYYNKEHYVEVSYYSHNESDSIGYFDGEEYNPQNFDDWYTDVASFELGDLEQYRDDELEEEFNKYCETLWADSSNEDNYEPTEDRFKRLAENLLEQLEDSYTTFCSSDNEPKVMCQGEDNLIFTNNGQVVVITEEENKFLEESGTHYLKLILDGHFSDYIKAFNEWVEENE